MGRYVSPLGEVRLGDLAQVGGKGAHLGELIGAGFSVPPGFSVKSEGHDRFFDTADLKKPIEEIIEQVKDVRSLLVLGCNECVTVCESGGKKEVAVLASALRMYFMKHGKEVKIDEITLERQCDHEYLEELRKVIDQYDIVLSLACGVGVQFLAEKYMRTPVLPGVDTCFMGVTEQRGVWTERCQGCGQCILARTGGICPVSRCAKRLFNGPCGGSVAGRCDACGGELYQRADDKEETVRERLKVFFSQTVPMIDYYERQGKLLRVNGNMKIDEVSAAITRALGVESA